MTWRKILLAIFGAWFFVSAWIMNPMHLTSYLWSAVIFGGLTLIASLWAMGDGVERLWRAWLIALFGLFLAITPYLYGFTSHGLATWITMIVGAATLVSGLWETRA